MDFGQIGDFFSKVVDYFKNFKASVLYKFVIMIVEFVKLIIAAVQELT